MLTYKLNCNHDLRPNEAPTTTKNMTFYPFFYVLKNLPQKTYFCNEFVLL